MTSIDEAAKLALLCLKKRIQVFIFTFKWLDRPDFNKQKKDR